jgi:hypothetical protein
LPGDFEQIRELVESLPEELVLRLRRHFQGSGSSASQRLCSIIDHELIEREMRANVFAPLPVFCSIASEPGALQFPAQTIALLWRGLSRLAPDEMQELREAWPRRHFVAIAGRSLDNLVARAALGLEQRGSPEFVRLAQLCEAAAPQGLQALLTALELLPMVRALAPRLPSWVGKVDRETVAAARLAYRDATGIEAAAGPVFLEMLAAQLEEPWRIMRIVSQIMDHPAERFLVQSEAATFAERLLAAIDRGLEEVGAEEATSTAAHADRAAIAAKLVLRQIRELGECVRLDPQGEWGAHVTAQRRRLAVHLEQAMQALPKAIDDALPQRPTAGGLHKRMAPDLRAAPQFETATAAGGLLRFVVAIGPCAHEAGVSATHSKTIKSAEIQLDAYTEGVFAHLRAHDAPLPPSAGAYLRCAGDLLEPLRPGVAGLIQRRTTAALAGCGKAA